ncbi:MAG: CpsB/CapC family capsule biosynthesis tyrosine phosphatase [Cyclobacteriaceae bacterium]
MPTLLVDMHSHLLPGLDDGVQTMEQAEEIILHLLKLGYTQLITTPHIMSDAYRNTPSGIAEKLQALKNHIAQKNIPVSISAAAEYYLDEALFKMVETDQPLLTFGNKYLLFETNFITEPFNLKDFIFLATTRGYKLILAHPERYLYLQNNLVKIEDLLDRGVLMQLNISSITGYYSKPVQQMAFKLIDKGWVHWLGSDCHHLQQARLLEEAQRSRYFRKALSLPLLNNTIR